MEEELNYSEKLINSNFQAQEFAGNDVLNSIINEIIFIEAIVFIIVCKNLYCYFFQNYGESKYCLFMIIFFLILIIFLVHCAIYLKNKVEKIIKDELTKKKNLEKYHVLIRIVNIILIIIGPFGIVTMFISRIDNEFLKGASISIAYNLLFYSCQFFIRQLAYKIIAYSVFTFFIYFKLHSSSDSGLNFLLVLFITSITSIFTMNNISRENAQLYRKAIEKILNKYNSFYLFFKKIPDLILLKSLNNDSLNYLNDASKKGIFNQENFSISKEELFNSANNNLKNTVEELIAKESKNEEETIINEEEFQTLSSEIIKVFKVVIIIFNDNTNRFLGISMKEISNTVSKIVSATTQKVSNKQICTFSHELRTPINQALALVCRAKKEAKTIELKINLGIAKSAILKLLLRVEEYLYDGKIISDAFAINKAKTSLKEIFSEIKQSNYEYFTQISKKRLKLNVDSQMIDVKIFLDIRLVQMIIQFILDNLIKDSNSYCIEITARLIDYNKITEFSFWESGKSNKKSAHLFNRGASIAPNYHALLNQSESSVQEVNEFTQIFVDKICNLLNTKIESSTNESNSKIITIKFDSTNGSSESLAVSESDFKENVTNSKDKGKEFHNISRFIKIKTKTKTLGNYYFQSSKKLIQKHRKPIVFTVDDDEMNRYAICGMLK